MTLREAARAAEDYRALREDAMRIDVPWLTALRLSGPDTRSFLQGLATQDLERTEAGRGVMTLFATEKGRPVALAWVALEGDDAGRIVADEVEPGALLRHLERFRVMEEVELAPVPEPVAAFAGPGRDRALAEATTPASVAIQASPLSFLIPGTGGSLPSADPGAAEAWRLGAGLPRAGIDFGLDRLVTELETPAAISLSKGCFVGQEVVARTSHRGQVRRSRAGFTLEWAGENPLPGAEVRTAAGQPVGVVTSVARVPGSTRGFAMGYLSTDPGARDSGLVLVQGSVTIPVEPRPWPLWH